MGSNDCCCGKYNAREGSKIIGVTSAVLSIISAIGCIWELIKLSRAESQLSQLMTSLRQLGEMTGDTSSHDQITTTIENRKMTLGIMVGIAFVCFLVAIALVFATKKNNRHLALPFMIWSIITQVACGIFIAMLVFLCAVADWSAEDNGDLFRYFVVPLVASVINFALYTWWLVVVFNFYNLLKSGQAFDSIPMQTA